MANWVGSIAYNKLGPSTRESRRIFWRCEEAVEGLFDGHTCPNMSKKFRQNLQIWLFARQAPHRRMTLLYNI